MNMVEKSLSSAPSRSSTKSTTNGGLVRFQLGENAHGFLDPKRRLVVLPRATLPAIKDKNIKFKELPDSDAVVIKHSAKNYIKLRKLLRHLAPPMALYYNWSGAFTPYYAQKVTAYSLSCFPRMYVLNSMGTGKTLASLWAMDWLMQEKVLRKALVVSPLSTLDPVWMDTIETHFPHRRAVILHGSQEQRLRRLAEDYDIYILNHDGLRVKPLHEKLLDMEGLDLILVDEGAVFRDFKTQRSKALRALCRKTPHVWWMTGTPMPNAPTDVWSQCMMVTPETVPPFFTRWRDMTMRKVSTYRWVPRKESARLCIAAMRPAVRFSLDDCVDLPECIHEWRKVPLTGQQKVVYTDLQRRMGSEMQGQRITPVNEGVKVGKLMQVCEGAVFDDDGNVVLLDYKNRLDEVKSIMEQVDGKVIVFATYVPTIERLNKDIKDSLVIHGGVSRKQRADIFYKFQYIKNKHRVLIAQPSTMSHGVTLTAARAIIWFGVPRGNETYLQANARIHRPGQKHKTVIMHLASTRAEMEVYTRYNNQQGLQGILLSAVQEKIK